MTYHEACRFLLLLFERTNDRVVSSTYQTSYKVPVYKRKKQKKKKLRTLTKETTTNEEGIRRKGLLGIKKLRPALSSKR